jgi:phage-related protein
MTSDASADVKEVIFVNEAANRDYADLPPDVREAADTRTTVLQNGGRLPAKQVRNLQGVLFGISEIRISYDDDTYRVYFVAEYAEAIYILDAGMKKSPKDGEIPRWQIDRLVARKQKADDHYLTNRPMLRRRAEDRRKVRAARDNELTVDLAWSPKLVR